jgi:Ser/Thr protein kinase RdoA (MazF antagonist)
MDNHPNLPEAALAQYDLGEIHAVESKTGGWIGEQEEGFVRDVMRQLVDRAEAVRGEIGLVSLTVHGALEPGNVLFGQEDEVAAWVDWADSAQFVRVYVESFAMAYSLQKVFCGAAIQ